MFFKVAQYEVFIETERTVKVQKILDWIVDPDTIEVWALGLHVVISRVPYGEGDEVVVEVRAVPRRDAQVRP